MNRPNSHHSTPLTMALDVLCSLALAVLAYLLILGVTL